MSSPLERLEKSRERLLQEADGLTRTMERFVDDPVHEQAVAVDRYRQVEARAGRPTDDLTDDQVWEIVKHQFEIAGKTLADVVDWP